MKLSVSNIAWRPDEDEKVAAVLRAEGFHGIEIAPTTIWPVPLGSTRGERQAVRQRWEDRGLPIVAMQSLLFGHPEFQLFGTAESRTAMLEYLGGILQLAADVGAQVLVFGSPGNRQRGALSAGQAQSIAEPFFREVGRRARAAGVCFCIEPNPPAYGCDFVTTSDEGRALVDAVNEPGFGLHLDGGGMTLAGEDPRDAVLRHQGRFRHFHVSAPQLAPVNPEVPIRYDAVAAALQETAYPAWVSIEMRSGPPGTDNAVAVATAARYCRSLFRA